MNIDYLDNSFFDYYFYTSIINIFRSKQFLIARVIRRWPPCSRSTCLDSFIQPILTCHIENYGVNNTNYSNEHLLEANLVTTSPIGKIFPGIHPIWRPRKNNSDGKITTKSIHF